MQYEMHYTKTPTALMDDEQDNMPMKHCSKFINE